MIGKTLFVVGVLIVAAIGYLFIPIGQGNELPASFGNWKLEVTGYSPDGTKIPMNVKTNNLQLLSFTFNGEIVDYVEYSLKAKATGSGYTNCEIDLSDVSSDGIIYEGSGGPGTYSYVWDDVYGETKNIVLNKDYVDVFKRIYSFDEITDEPDGDYTMEIRFRGDASFRGRSSSTVGDWQTEEIRFTSTLDLVSEGGGSGGGSSPDITYDFTVNTNPSGAHVQLKGPNYDKTYMTPTTIRDLKKGVYSYRVYKTGYIEQEGSLYLDSDDSVYVVLPTQIPDTALLTVRVTSYSKPTIHVDGITKEGWEAEFTLMEGTHRVVVENSRYTKSQTVNLYKDTVISFNLNTGLSLIPSYSIDASSTISSYGSGDYILGS